MPFRFDSLAGFCESHVLFDNIINFTMALPNMKVLGTNDPTEQVNVLLGWVEQHCEIEDEKVFNIVKNAIVEVQGYDPEAVTRLYKVVTGELDAFWDSRTPVGAPADAPPAPAVDPNPWMPYASEEEYRADYFQHFGHYPEDVDDLM